MGFRYKQEVRLQGLPISGGVAVAKVCLFNEGRHANLPAYRVSGEGLERELSRINQAVGLVVEQLDALRSNVATRIGQSESEIVMTQTMMLQDANLIQRMLDAVREESHNAETAVASVLEAYEARLLSLENERIKERATDVGEIKRRLLDILSNKNPCFQCEGLEHCQKGRNRVVIAEELTPSLTLELDTEHIRGFVTERGGVTSHAAILARSLGIPAITGVKGIYSAISCGVEVLVNGHTGELVIWPLEKTKTALSATRTADKRALDVLPPTPELTVLANISVSTDVDEAIHFQAEGIGLYRTEFEFFAAGRILTEDEQYARYAHVVKAMRGRPVTFRLLDVGGDKEAPYFDMPEEENPYLGLRGSRFLLARPDLLETQARALARASVHGPVRVLYPMIIEAEQFLALKKMVQQTLGGLPSDGLTHGVMFEVPSACLQARDLLKLSDFASIGTNDLIQYLFAVDRNNERVSYDYSPNRTVFWSLLREMARAADNLGKPLSVCGELGADTTYLPRLMEIGIRAVSVSAKLIPSVRHAVKAAPKKS